MQPTLTDLDGDLTALTSEVSRRFRGRLWRLTIEQGNEGLVLSGAAGSFYVKQLTQHAVGRLTRLPIARNEIEVA